MPSPTPPGLGCRSLYNSGPSWRASRESWILDLYEYQGKELLKKYGLETLPGIVAGTPEEAGRAAEDLGGTVAIKAQVLTGGRGKAGGIKVVNSPQEGVEAAAEI